MLSQYVIIRQNCESYVAWGESKDEALAEFVSKGHAARDAWRILKKWTPIDRYTIRDY